MTDSHPQNHLDPLAWVAGSDAPEKSAINLGFMALTDSASLIVAALAENDSTLGHDSIVVVAQKIVSKSEGRFAWLDEVVPSDKAQELACITGKDARLVELTLSESTRVLRAVPGVLIVRHRLGYVMANAGIDKASSFAKQSLADFRAVFDTSFFGNLNLVHALWPQLISQGYGRVILTTSSAGLYANHGQSAYSAAKAAVIGLMRSLALEGQRHGVKVNAIAPYGYSQMTAPYMPQEMARLFDPALVAPLVGWLASQACCCSGEVLVSGAGFIRRAETAETVAIAMEAGQLDSLLTQLQSLPHQTYANASASFAQFLQEINPPTENA